MHQLDTIIYQKTISIDVDVDRSKISDGKIVGRQEKKNTPHYSKNNAYAQNSKLF